MMFWPSAGIKINPVPMSRKPPNSAYFDPVTQQWYEINPVFLNVQNFILNWSGDPKFA